MIGYTPFLGNAKIVRLGQTTNWPLRAANAMANAEYVRGLARLLPEDLQNEINQWAGDSLGLVITRKRGDIGSVFYRDPEFSLRESHNVIRDVELFNDELERRIESAEREASHRKSSAVIPTSEGMPGWIYAAGGVAIGGLVSYLIFSR